jgi:hypothetical protein
VVRSVFEEDEQYTLVVEVLVVHESVTISVPEKQEEEEVETYMSYPELLA